jgi:large subunit ribosomal protein L23
MANETNQARVKDYGVLITPVITEKSANLAGDKTRVVFKVQKSATKTEIKAAIERIFNVKVDSVNTLNYMGKVKRRSGLPGRRASFKKAYVILKAGEKIQVVEGI